MKVCLLGRLLLHKYKMKPPIMKEDMLKIADEKHPVRFAEILKRASEHIEIFPADFKEICSTSHS
ncbi:hypothetical protein MC885_007489 [Smutsia gigantea]|nr:hypothetical protein MC885_007489 [Smutsia gigantea]